MRLEKVVAQDPIALTPTMADVLCRAHAFAPAATPVILYGETGTGKTFLAEYIHQVSQRSGGFHGFSVGTEAPQLVVDKLFGHVRGAYTDAREVRAGLIATAGGGTLLLDDMQGLDLGMQQRLFQVLDRRTYSPEGSDRVVTVACRIILAMTEDPDVLMKNGVLLTDLRYRFGECAIRIAPLRERREEIPVHAQRALEGCPHRTTVEGPTRFSDAAMAVLCDADWPGNVRQLRGVVDLGFLLARIRGASEIGAEHLPEGLCPPPRYQRRGDPRANRVAVERALRQAGGNVKRAAQLLGVNRITVHAVMARRAATG